MGEWQGVLLGVSAFLSAVAVLVAIGAFRVATRAARTADSYPQTTEESRKMMNSLKDEVEAGIDKLEVYLGRISRMRRQDSPRKIDVDQVKQAVAQLNGGDDSPPDGGGIMQNTTYATPDEEGISPRQRLLRGR